MAGGTSPCASCKLLRRRCAKDCVFAPYFPPDDPHKFAIVHKVFGASNISKMLQELPVQQRGDAVSSLVYEANARMRDPVYGCVGAISYLQNQVSQLQMQLAVAQAEILCIQMQQTHDDNHMIVPLLPAANCPQLDDIIISDKSHLLFATNYNNNNHNLININNSININSNNNNLQQYYLSFANNSTSSSSTNNVMQDPLKRESLWT
ncbi:hypothetical protein ABFS83_14G067700 [Erythranthe nasuta]